MAGHAERAKPRLEEEEEEEAEEEAEEEDRRRRREMGRRCMVLEMKSEGGASGLRLQKLQHGLRA